MNTRDQSGVRLRAMAVVAAGLLLLAARPGVAPVWAAPADELTLLTSDSAAATLPETNPYSNPTQCVYRAWDLAAQVGHRLPYFGNAALWRQGAIDAGYTVIDTLDASAVHSVAVWGSGVGGASVYGHVGWVVDVRDGEFLVQDRNWIAYGTDDERWVTWEPGISFIVLEGAGAAEPTPTPSPTPHPTPKPSPTPSPTPEPSPAPSPTPVPWFMATAVPADATRAQAGPVGRRVADSPASRSGRRPTAPGVPMVAAATPAPWYAALVVDWSDILGLQTLDADLTGYVGQVSGPLRWLAAPVTERAPGAGVAIPTPGPAPAR